MLHPQAPKRPALVLDDNGAWDSTVSSQSRIFSDTRTGDGGFQGPVVGDHQLRYQAHVLPKNGDVCFTPESGHSSVVLGAYE
jgi:hypothetical protein